MIKSYLTIAWRNLRKNKAHALINIIGLSVGLACSLLILLWVQDELGIDAFHKDNAHLFAVFERVYSGNKPEATYSTPALIPAELKKDIPEIEYATGTGWKDKHLFRVGNKTIKFEGTSADSDYFKMFNFPLLQGDARSALKSASGIAISRKMAESFFGSPQSAMGKMLKYDNKQSFIVTAVFENFPQAADKKYNFLTSWTQFFKEYPWAKDMNNRGPKTFIRLRADADEKLVAQKLFHYLRKFFKDKKLEGYSAELELQRVDEVYLHGHFTDGKIDGGKIEYVRMFSIVAVFILLIACINFMNLTIARSIKRAREVGVRKVVGASRASLIRQFMLESLLVTAMAVVIALVLLILLLPVFNGLTQKQIALPFGSGSFWLRLVAIALITGLISGSYPALFLSSFNTVKVLKGTVKTGSGAILFRKGLVIFQFSLSIILITGTIVVSRQINYVQSANLGYDRENLVYIPMEGNLKTGFSAFKNEALKIPGIESIAGSSDMPTDVGATDDAVEWDNKDPNFRMEFVCVFIGYDYTKTLKMQMAQGRDYSKDFPSDTANYLINEATLKIIGYTDPIGRRFKLDGKPGKIIGVLKDFHPNSLRTPIWPMIMLFGETANPGNILIRVQSGHTQQALAGLESLCKQLNPDFPFTYSFADDEYTKLYADEQVVGKLSKAFASLAILISCLGLLGLGMFTTEQRIKEIGIRKVLGASSLSLFTLLSSEFIWLILIALLIAVPAGWYAMYRWLQNFSYHTAIQWWFFALAAGMTIAIAIAIISVHTMRAALANPVKSLRSE